MGTPGNQTAQYFLADPQEPKPLSVEIPSPFAGGRIVFVDLCVDLPGARGQISQVFEKTGLHEAPGDILVLRGAERQFKERVDSDPGFRDLLSQGQPVLCLYGNGDSKHRPKLERPRWSIGPALEPTLEELRAIEMYGLLAARGGLLGGSRMHYELPGGPHVETYVRLRKALEVQHDCRRVIDWLLPDLSNGCQVLVAHRGLGAFQIALESRVKELQWDVEVHHLPRYDQSRGRDAHVPVSMEPDESRKQVVVIGVDTKTREERASGGEREHRLNVSGYGAAPKLCLVDTTFPEPAMEAFVHIPVKQSRAEHCERCQQRRPQVARIDPDDEIPTPTAMKRERLTVSKGDILSDKDFWEVVEHTKAAAVHVSQRYEGPHNPEARRHRAFDINVEKLLQDPMFHSECTEQLGHLRVETGDCLVLIPDHERAGALKRLAEDALVLPPASVRVVPRLDPAEGLDVGAPEPKRLILFDDILLTGATAMGMSSKLRDHFGKERFAQMDVRCFVVLNCAATDDRVKAVISNLTPGKGHRGQLLRECRRIPLPPASEPCPWCSEKAWLQGRLAGPLGSLQADYFTNRLEALSQTPMKSLSPVAAAEPVLEETLIGTISAETALLRWASALQAKRITVREPGEPEPPGYYVDIRFVASRWKDWAQCAGILRVAGEGEVRYSGQEEAFAEAWEIEAPGMKLSKLAEFGWAAIEGKLTPPSTELVMRTLSEKAEEDPALAAFADLLEAREQVGGGQAA